MKINADRLGRKSPQTTPTANSIVATGSSSNLDAWVTKYPTVQSVVTGSRAANGTVYQNTTGRPMFVLANVQTNGGAGTDIIAYTDTANPPTTIVSVFSSYTPGANITHGFWVLNNSYYKINVAAGTPLVVHWTEWY